MPILTLPMVMGYSTASERASRTLGTVPVSGPRAEVRIPGVGHGMNWLAQCCAFFAPAN